MAHDTIALLAIFLIVSLDLGCHSKAPSDTTTSYRGHRVLLWSFDRDTHALTGFAEGTVHPDPTMPKDIFEQMKSADGFTELRPTSNCLLRLRIGPVTTVTYVSDFVHEWNEPAVEGLARYQTTGLGMTLPLRQPTLSKIFLLNQHTDAILSMVPFDGMPANATSAALASPLKGTRGECESLILSAAVDGAITADLANQLYEVFGPTESPARWTSRMNDSRSRETRLVAITVLSKFGDSTAQRHFAQLCMETRSNDQLALAKLITSMPASDTMLEALVYLVMADRAYCMDVPPHVGVGDLDYRPKLEGALLTRFSSAQLRPYEPRLRKWATSNHRTDFEKALDLSLARA